MLKKYFYSEYRLEMRKKESTSVEQNKWSYNICDFRSKTFGE
jgi:hypothetical protein